ncbi:MAG: hypothetical protein D6805_01745 [Planctomycetota bacterium]|nr:MAG: hypothetical protein D6805_01745 [Planctomycetota bacterium]
MREKSKIFQGYRAGKLTRVLKVQKDEDFMEGSTTLEELLENFHQPQRGILLYKPSVIRRLVRVHREMSHIAFQVPHTEEYVLSKEDFLRCLRMDDPRLLKNLEVEKLPEFLVLLSLPSRRERRQHRIEFFAHRYWSYLFHAEIHLQCYQRQKDGHWSEILLNQCLRKIGAGTFEEIRDVLQTENFLFSPDNDEEVFFEFLSYSLQLLYFYTRSFFRYFPSLKNRANLPEELAKIVGIHIDQALEKTLLPYTPSIQKLKETYHARLVESYQTVSFYRPQYHIHNIRQYKGLDALTEREREDFDRQTTQLIPNIVHTIIQEGKIVQELDFITVRNMASKEGLTLSHQQLLLLDDAIYQSFGALYTPATWWQKWILSLRPSNSLELDRENQRRKQTTQKSLHSFCEVAEKFNHQNISLGRYIFYRIWRFLFLVLGGWALYFYARGFFLLFPSALSVWDSYRRHSFFRLYFKALLAKRKGNLVLAMINFRKAMGVVEEFYHRYEIQEANQLRELLNQEFRSYIRPVAENFITQTKIEAQEHQKRLESLIEYLVHKTVLSKRSMEEHLLLDIQSSYVDAQKEFSQLDLFGWLSSLGKSPLVFPLKYYPLFRKLKYLQSAQKKVDKLKLPRKIVLEYSETISQACKNSNLEISKQLRPILEKALLEHGFSPKLAQEKIAFEKIQTEFLQLILQRGHSYFSNLRDVISKNDLKLKDVGLWDLFFLDPLLKLDKTLGKELKGIHRPAEVYIRLLQRLSSLFFGTGVGRFLSKYLIVPLGSSVLILTTLSMTIGHFTDPPLQFLDLTEFPDGYRNIFSLAVAILAVLYVGKVRQFFLDMLRMGWVVGRALLRIPLDCLAKLRKKYKKFVNFFLSPLLSSAVLLGLTIVFYKDQILFYQPPHWQEWQLWGGIGFLYFQISLALINTRAGVLLGGLVADTVSVFIERLTKDFLLALFQLAVKLTRSAMAWMEHLLYVFEDYLRFSRGEGYFQKVVKVFFILFWLPVAYILTIYIILFLEPQVNPLKFPVVSITYKLLIPFYGDLNASLFHISSSVLPVIAAKGFAYFTTFFFSGIFGFLMWELKENWRLYYHNRATHITPLSVGSHGETIPQLLRPGFHSGTIPHLFRKYRNAVAEARISGDTSKLLAIEKEIDHLQKDLERFLKADFLYPLSLHPLLEDVHIRAHSVEISSNTIHFSLSLRFPPSSSSEQRKELPLQILLEEKNGQLLATFPSAKELQNLPPLPRFLFLYLLGTFYKKCQVDILREQLEYFLTQRYPNYSLESSASNLLLYEIRAGKIVVKLISHQQQHNVEFYLKRKISTSRSDPSSEPIQSEEVRFSTLLYSWEDFNQIYTVPDPSFLLESYMLPFRGLR